MSRIALGIVLTLTSLTVGCAATSETSAGTTAKNEVHSETAAAEQTAAANDPDEVVCKRVTKVGTRFKERICATRRQWELHEQQGQQVTEEMQRQGAFGRE